GINSSPEYLVNTNLVGTINCLYLAAKTKADFIFLSTSRVYPIETIDRINYEEAETRFTISRDQTIEGVSEKGLAENFPLTGFRSIYGATKLCSEFLIQEFNKYYDFNAVINRCGVLTGPWQMGKVDQGVMVLWVARHFWKRPLGYFGYGGRGKQVRDMLHVDDLFTLIDHQIHNMGQMNGKTMNVGGGLNNSLSLQELTKICQRVTGNTIQIEEVKENRQADIRIYITDNSLISNLSGWKPFVPPEEMVNQIFLWIKKNEKALMPILGS
ncbi:MAG: GDP-mannose 4,6-dehydratase, partial [Cyclobacteriaceae bacterium]|nr:GDP-mannose 4,6-dehydratase [Cyclobacteriaceae bacterium]